MQYEKLEQQPERSFPGIEILLQEETENVFREAIKRLSELESDEEFQFPEGETSMVLDSGYNEQGEREKEPRIEYWITDDEHSHRWAFPMDEARQILRSYIEERDGKELSDIRWIESNDADEMGEDPYPRTAIETGITFSWE